MDDGFDRTPERYEVEGCLTTLIRIPVRVVVLVIVLPVRMIWDLLAAARRAAGRVVLRPLGRALVWLYEHALVPLARALFVLPWVALWRHVVVPIARYGIALPLTWLYAAVLTPVGRGLRRMYDALLVPAGRGIAAAVALLVAWLLVRPVAALWRYVLTPLARGAALLLRVLVVLPLVWSYHRVLTPLGHGVAAALVLLGRLLAVTGRGLRAASVWLIMTLLVRPVTWVYRRFLAPAGREIATAFGVAWRIAGFLSRAVGRFLARLAWLLVGAPVTWAYRTVCTPVGHVLRDTVWAPAKRAAVEAGRTAGSAWRAVREGVRGVRRDAWRALVGPPRATAVRELGGPAARTLEGTTTVPGAAPASEDSPLAGPTVERG